MAIANVALSFSHLDFGPTLRMKTSGELGFITVPAIAWSLEEDTGSAHLFKIEELALTDIHRFSNQITKSIE